MPRMPAALHCPAVHRFAMLLLLLAAQLAVTSSASAGTYTVDSCQRPDGTPSGREGWTANFRGDYTYAGDNCVQGGTLDAYWASDIEHNYGDLARWAFTAPTGTAIRSIGGVRSARAAPGRDYGTPVTVVRADGSYLEQCGTSYNCSTRDGEFLFATDGARTVYFGVECGGGVGGRCPGGITSIAMRRLRVTLDDVLSPTLNGVISGSLSSTSSTARIRTVNYSATDIGGGIYRHRLLADGKEVAGGPVDENAGRCVRYRVGNGFSSPVPCRTTASGNLTFDTSALSDGSHEVELQIFDATDENKVVSAWTIQVDNVAPSIGEAEVTGVAREGEVLRCRAAVAGQSARVGYRWSRADAGGSDNQDIAGATEAAYTLASADIGKKLQCRVTATDGGGASTKTSSAAAGPFAGGEVVKSRPANAPVGSDGPSGSSGSSGSNGPTGPQGMNGLNGASGADGAGGAGGSTAAVAPVCPAATVIGFGAKTSMLRSYRRSSFWLTGRLMARSGGEAVSGGVLDVVQTVKRAGTSQRKTIGTVRTEPDGSFRARVPVGPTRSVQLVHASCGSVAPAVSQRVRGVIHAKTSTRRIRNKQLARFTGRVLGGYLGRGLPLELQVKVGASWRDVKAVTTNARGEYRVSYRFLRTYVRYTYRFRVVSRAGSAWPYMAAKSGQVKVRVN